MDYESTALILIGYQNDYFAKDGILRGVLENDERTTEVLNRTVSLVNSIKETPVKMVATPIIFTKDYSEIKQADGILAAIKQAGAFQAGEPGAATVPEIADFGDRIDEVPGKRGLNAFVETDLHKELESGGITHVAMAGAVTSICIDSTARAAYEKGMRVFILEDCTASRTDAEQSFFCDTVFPTYAEVIDSGQFISRLAECEE